MVAKLGQGATYISGEAADASFLPSFPHPTCRGKQPCSLVAFFKMPPRRVALSVYQLLEVAAL